MQYSSEPVAQSCSINNPVYQRITKNLSHDDFGTGVRVEGRQLFTDITTSAGDNQLFAGTGTASVTANYIYLSPDVLSGRLALQARNYSRYAFRRVMLHYVPRVATSDVGQFVIAYNPTSSSALTPSLSFSALTSNGSCMVSAFRKETKMEVRYTGDLTWTTEYDNTSTAGVNTSCQGAILGYPDASSIGALQHGWIWIEYVVDLYGSSQDFGFTLSLKDEEEQSIARAAVERFRKAKQAERDDDDFGFSVSSGAGGKRR